jgi:hypothetical protein
MKKPYILFLFLSNFLSVDLLSQTPFCGSSERYLNLIQNQPEVAQKMEIENQKLIDFVRNAANNTTESSTSYILPIVVHVIAPPGALLGSKHNISNLEIIKGLEMINQAFANENDFFSSDGVDSEISFCLARKDPNGNPTNGINRIYSDLVVGNNQCDDFSTSVSNEILIKDLIRWDCKRYINIWLVTDLFYPLDQNCGIGGFAYYAGASCSIDGIMMETRYWNKKAAIAVAAHEIGHHLNLRHTFSSGCTNSDCSTQGDYVCDTPPDNSIVVGNCNENSCNTDIPDLQDDTHNYMDYSICTPKHFTPGQVSRMKGCLETSRINLTQTNNCNSITNNDVSLLNFKLPNGTCDTKSCPTILIQNNGNQSITQLTIDQTELNSGQTNMTLWTGNLLPNASIEISLNCLEVGLGIKNIKVSIPKVNNQTDDYNTDNDYFLQNIEFFPAVFLSVDMLDTAICGLDGRVLLKTSNGTSPFIFD